jgi:hypothetical protein
MPQVVISPYCAGAPEQRPDQSAVARERDPVTATATLTPVLRLKPATF